MIYKLNCVDSTQTYCKTNIDNLSLYDSVYALSQNAGYGRSGMWESNNPNIYFSIIIPTLFNSPLIAICAMHMLCANYNHDIKIKWPNDLYYKQQKLGGFIIEQMADKQIIGIGINVHPPAKQFTSLSQLTKQKLELDDLIITLNNLILENVGASHAYLEQYFITNCNMLNRHLNYIDLKTNEQLSGRVTDISFKTITINNICYHPMQIKILDK